ncbi:3 phosphatase [uncultured virus]|nr:3 phosphatase [uncultured virus]
MLTQLVPGLYAAPGYIQKTGDNYKVAAFDLDWTIIRSVRGRFPKDADDWAFLPNRISTIKSYQDAGYIIVIFTNQGYKGAKLTMAINRINNVLAALATNGIIPWIFVAAGGDQYRKPNIGMWQAFEQSVNPIDKTTSFYIGDAAGRPQDHSRDDIDFAAVIGIPFFTPERLFPNNTVEIPTTQTMFIFVGMPGSGKSTYYTQNLQPRGWIHINQDNLKTVPKMLATARTAIMAGQSVAIDATNPDPNKRRSYIELAAQLKIPVLIIYFIGNGYEGNKLRPNPVPNIAYNVYFKNLVEPTQELDRVPVVQVV